MNSLDESDLICVFIFTSIPHFWNQFVMPTRAGGAVKVKLLPAVNTAYIHNNMIKVQEHLEKYINGFRNPPKIKIDALMIEGDHTLTFTWSHVCT